MAPKLHPYHKKKYHGVTVLIRYRTACSHRASPNCKRYTCLAARRLVPPLYLLEQGINGMSYEGWRHQAIQKARPAWK